MALPGDHSVISITSVSWIGPDLGVALVAGAHAGAPVAEEADPDGVVHPVTWVSMSSR